MNDLKIVKKKSGDFAGGNKKEQEVGEADVEFGINALVFRRVQG